MPAVRLMLIGVFILQASRPSGAQGTGLEYDVKAAFLLNFTRYVEWPASRARAPFRMCLLTSNPFGKRLETVVAGETWQEEAISVKVVRELGDTPDCDLLYVPADATDRFAGNRRQIASRPILTVGETRRFFTSDGMIQLFVQDGKVRFSINQRAAALAGLTISSRLLRLARELVPPESAP